MSNQQSVPVRPESRIKSNLEASNGRHIRPGVSGQEVVHGGVLNASTLSDTSNAVGADDAQKVQREVANDLSNGVAADLIRPVRAAGAGRLALGSSHEGSVEVSEGSSGTASISVVGVGDGGSNQQTEELADMAKRIERYVPKIAPEHWDHLEAFVRDAIRDAEPDRWSTAQTWLSYLTQHALWCWRDAGMDLEREVIFDPNTISRYINAHPDFQEGSRATVRSVLLRISNRLLGERGDAWEHRRYGNSKGSVPYSREDVTNIRAYLGSESTEYRRNNLRALVALGGGAGLSPSELLVVTKPDVEVSVDGVFVHIHGARARRVPLIAEWDDLMLDTIARAKNDDLLVLEDRVVRGKSVISDFLCSCTGNGLRPHMQRLRSTWLLAHLNARTPFPVLMKAAGLSGLASLDRYMKYVAPLPGEAEVSLLRLDGGSK